MLPLGHCPPNFSHPRHISQERHLRNTGWMISFSGQINTTVVSTTYSPLDLRSECREQGSGDEETAEKAAQTDLQDVAQGQIVHGIRK